MVSSLKEEYATIRELGADVVAISADDVAVHVSFCGSIGGCPFPLASDSDREVSRVYEAMADDGRSGKRVIYVLNEEGTIIHKIPWYQPGNVGQFFEVFQALGLE